MKSPTTFENWRSRSKCRNEAEKNRGALSPQSKRSRGASLDLLLPLQHKFHRSHLRNLSLPLSNTYNLQFSSMNHINSSNHALIQNNLGSTDPATISRAMNAEIGADVAAKKAKKKKLEDYLDPAILSAIRAQLNHHKTEKASSNSKSSDDFERPLSFDDSVIAVNLSSDDVDGKVAECEEEEFGSPFQQFDRTVSSLCIRYSTEKP
ncbi:hypothetical protein Scep_015789 [Stephania cephalantha]|uniref:Uncharacterized protein n=1 Tax=Stephania cephalantha TaxID=152367 RepID=A0AAP0J3V1_9MAGN